MRFHQLVPVIGTANAVDLDPDNKRGRSLHVPARKADLVIEKRGPDGILLAEDRIILQHSAARMLGKPVPQAHLLARHIIHLASLERALDGIADFLSPPRACGVVAERGVVVHGPDQGEFKRLAINLTVIDAPAVAQAAIGWPDGLSADFVSYLMVVVEHVNRESLLLAPMVDAENLLIQSHFVVGSLFEPFLGDRQKLEPADPVSVEQPINKAPECSKNNTARYHGHAALCRHRDKHPDERSNKGNPEKQDG